MINQKGLTRIISEDKQTLDTNCNYCNKSLDKQDPSKSYISKLGNGYCSFKHFTLFTED
jgi:hypothetical protein